MSVQIITPLLVLLFVCWEGMILPLTGAETGVRASAVTGLSAQELNERGLDLLRKNRYSQAERAFAAAVQKNSMQKQYHNNRAVACMKQKKYQSACRHLEIAISLDPRYVKAISNMAIVCFHLFRFQESYHYYSRARAIDRGYMDRRFTRDRIVKNIRRLKAENPDNKTLDDILRRLE